MASVGCWVWTAPRHSVKDSDFYYLATVLDPRVKTEWIKQNLRDPDEVIRRVRDLLKATYLPLDSQLPDNSQDEYQTLEYQFLLPLSRRVPRQQRQRY